MNTSEVLDLSKENIQPLKQGRNAAILGTALQAQTNTELQQKLLAEREKFELLIRMYEGDDPLSPYYEYVHWIEQSFPKHGPESNFVQVLENTLALFKEDIRYKQDLRYAELLIKYIDIQPNPLEIYQLVYDQGLCTMCALFYKAWADELDKNNDFKAADEIYELGIRVKAKPVELLQEAQLRFQLSIARRMLGRQEEVNEVDNDNNRQALHKLQKHNIHSIRDPLGAPGRVKQQQPLANHNSQRNAPFKIYQGEDTTYNACGDGQGKVFPKHGLLHKENSLKPGPWTQGGGKYHRKHPAPTTSPSFKVHEDEGADIGSGLHRTPTVLRALKSRKLDDFTCPLAVFEPPDPTKRPMYCKNKVYAGGREFQFEELRGAIYNRRYEQEMMLKKQQEMELAERILKQQELEKQQQELLERKDSIDVPLDADVNMLNTNENNEENVAVKNVEELPCRPTPDKPPFQHLESPHQEFEVKTCPLEANTSLFHCQSFTVNTKEAMNVVQEMWNSPSPAQAFGKRASRAYPVSPVALDESGVFKVPPPPLGKLADASPKPAAKTMPSFPIYTDDEPAAPPPVQPFQVYTDEAESENINGENEKEPAISDNFQSAKQCENAALPPQPLGLPTVFPPALSQCGGGTYLAGVDAGTLKMLAFQSDSDSDDSCKKLLPITKHAARNIPSPTPPFPLATPAITTTAPSPAREPTAKHLGGSHFPQPPVFEEDKFDDVTCNTKAFAFVLPSSTPLVRPGSQPEKYSNNDSYIGEDIKKCPPKQDLSMIFEASKERFSSSSGSSGNKTQGSVCAAANTSIAPAPAPTALDDLQKSIGLLNISGPIDPFSTELITNLLTHIGYPKQHHLPGLQRFDTDAPPVHTNSNVKLGDVKYSVIGELGKGNYARVLKAMRDGQPVALKQQRPAWEWEWYITQELQARVPPNMSHGYLHMSNGYIYKNASILESEWAQYGSILSVVNKLKQAGKGNDLHLAMLFSIELISIVDHLHKCKIIHGDIKPDNFVMCSLPSLGSTKTCLKLIDFGRSIDMTLFPEGTTFHTVVSTDGFTCNEMKENRPWTYQTDLYGLAGSIYCVLFYDYMKVIKKDKWQLTNKVPRYMKPAVWDEIFTALLNVKSCEELPDLTALRTGLENHLKSMDSSTVSQSINKLSCVLLNK